MDVMIRLAQLASNLLRELSKLRVLDGWVKDLSRLSSLAELGELQA
jgi:hypothetical protein